MEIPGPGLSFSQLVGFAIGGPMVVSRCSGNALGIPMVVLNGRGCSFRRNRDPDRVPVRASVPAPLRNGPFTSKEASAAGVKRGQLRGARYRRLGSGLYRWAGLQESPLLLLTGVAKRLPDCAAFSGNTSGWLHGLDVAPCDPIEVILPDPVGSRRRAGVLVRRASLRADEIVMRRGLPTTSALRTVVDLGGRGPLVEGVVAADLALHAQLISIAELRAYVAEHPGAKGIARLRRVAELAELKTESPMETRLRMLLVLGGLPRPEVQASIRDVQGHFLGRPDLLFRAHRLAIEFDGANHRERLVDDNRRQNGLVDAGFTLLRFTAADVYRTPDRVVMQTRGALRASTPSGRGPVPGRA